jgi:hypothetical protein
MLPKSGLATLGTFSPLGINPDWKQGLIVNL